MAENRLSPRRLSCVEMPRAPRITGADVLRALRRLGWRQVRQRGSHVYLKHPDQPRLVTVPMHSGEVIKPKTLASILDQAGLQLDEFRQLL